MISGLFSRELRTRRELHQFVAKASGICMVAALALDTAMQVLLRATLDSLLLNLAQTFAISLIVAVPVTYLIARMNVKLTAAKVELVRLSRTDGLTDLLNRRAFLAAVEPLCRDRCVLAIMDIDRFKRINDLFGHPAGDAVIRMLADKLVGGLPGGLLARMGGEEFAFLTAADDLPTVARHIERIRRDVASTPFKFGSDLIHVTFSAGVAERAGSDFAALYGAADNTLYRAKSLGRNVVLTEAHVDGYDADGLIGAMDLIWVCREVPDPETSSPPAVNGPALRAIA